MATKATARATGAKLTETFVREATALGQASAWYSDGTADHDRGALYLRVQAGGAKTWYYRFAVGHRQRGAVRLGHTGTMTLKAARDECAKLRAKRGKDGRDLGAVLKREAEANRAAEHAARLASEKTLAVLCELYWKRLEDQGKEAWRDVRNILTNHLIDALPALAARPAAEVTPKDVTTAMRRLTEKGKARTAGKLRSFLAAAYNLALHAETDATAPAAFLGFHVIRNPAQLTRAIKMASRERCLTEAELREVLCAVRGLPDGPVRSALLLTLLLGGQRHTQLVRAELADVDLSAGTILLRDPKGKRAKPRLHLLPLQGEALRLVAALVERSKALESPHLFAANKARALGSFDLARAMQPICAALVKAKVVTDTFRVADLRRTTETMLAGMGVSADTLARLLSHGLGGVQAKVYNKHDYWAEKQAALKKWERRLTAIEKNEAPRSNVVPLQQGART